MWENLPQIQKKICDKIIYVQAKWVESGISAHFFV